MILSGIDVIGTGRLSTIWYIYHFSLPAISLHSFFNRMLHSSNDSLVTAISFPSRTIYETSFSSVSKEFFSVVVFESKSVCLAILITSHFFLSSSSSIGSSSWILRVFRKKSIKRGFSIMPLIMSLYFSAVTPMLSAIATLQCLVNEVLWSSWGHSSTQKGKSCHGRCSTPSYSFSYSAFSSKKTCNWSSVYSGFTYS